MKKLVVLFLCICLLIGSTQHVSHAATSAPTNSWNLQPTAMMEQLGIFTDPINRRGIYLYSQVTVNNGGSNWFSNYYYIASAPKHFFLYGHSASNPANQDVYVGMQDKIYSGSDHLDGRILLYNQSYFANYYDDSIFLVSNQAFFFFNIPAEVGPSVTLSGEMETY